MTLFSKVRTTSLPNTLSTMLAFSQRPRISAQVCADFAGCSRYTQHKAAHVIAACFQRCPIHRRFQPAQKQAFWGQSPDFSERSKPTKPCATSSISGLLRWVPSSKSISLRCASNVFNFPVIPSAPSAVITPPTRASTKNLSRVSPLHRTPQTLRQQIAIFIGARSPISPRCPSGLAISMSEQKLNSTQGIFLLPCIFRSHRSNTICLRISRCCATCRRSSSTASADSAPSTPITASDLTLKRPSGSCAAATKLGCAITPTHPKTFDVGLELHPP